MRLALEAPADWLELQTRNLDLKMPVYNDNALALDRQPRPRVVRTDSRRTADRHRSDDGTLIFCGISLALLVVALCIAASGHADISAVML